MKNLTLIGPLLLGIGFAIGWIAKPVPATIPVPVAAAAPPAKPVVPDATAAAAAPPPGKHAIRELEDGKKPKGPDKKEIEKQAKEMQANMAKAMVDRTRKKFEMQIDRLVEKLNLGADQKAKMTAWLEDNMKGLEKIDYSDPLSFSAMAKPGGMPTEKSMMEALSATLTPEQKDGLVAFEENEHQSKVDASALKSLSKLQGVIQFDEGQRDQVYKVLTEISERRINAESQKPDPTAMFTEGMGMDMDPYDLGLTSMMSEMSAEQFKDMDPNADPKDAMKMVKAAMEKRIDERVELLRPVLNAKQLELYRNELKTKGMGMYGGALLGGE